jgi:hypothetical protein
MPASDVIDQASQASARTMRSRLRGYLVRRTRQLLRLLVIIAIGLLFLAGVLEGWRAARMIGLPDNGEPFDVAAFRAFRVPPENDAFVLFRQAQKKLSAMPSLPLAVRQRGPLAWSKSAPELRNWVAANRDVLEMFRAASDRTDGIPLPNPDRDDPYGELKFGQFVELTRLETSRLEEDGDMAGAWNLYRAVFRMQSHERERGKPPPADEALVGPYLDHLPDDGSDELDDGKTPTVRDDKA